MKSYPCPRCKTGRLVKAGMTPGGKQRWSCQSRSGQDSRRTLCYKTTDPTAGAVINQRGDRSKPGKPLKFVRDLSKAKTFIITSAQNGTPVHREFFAALQQFAVERKAELVVIPLRYKNPTSQWTLSQQNAEAWATEVLPYLYNGRKELNSNVMLLADIKTQPTASSPLTGFEGISHGESCILGHTKLQMKVVATPQHKFPKIMTTTGSCTRPNYTDSRAGKLGEFHHTLGAVIVEVVDEKIFHLRHVNAIKSTGIFTDIDRAYGPNGSVKADPPAALIMGDTHVDFIDPRVYAATFAKGGIVDRLQPSTLVYHDLLDAYAVNPHHRGNPFIAHAKRSTGRDNVRDEVQRAINFVIEHGTGRQSIVVPSNHDNFLSRWVVDTDWRDGTVNPQFYLETALAMLKATRMGDGGTEYPSPFAYWFNLRKIPGARALRGNESFALEGVELGMHGDLGPNGARGSISNLRRIGVRSVIGHSHSPGIDEGCYQVGTSTSLRLEYNRGPSGWLNTHCILHRDGKRQLINIINGEWRL